MKIAMRCNICNEVKKVNGQNGISNFVVTHQHNQSDLQLKINPDVTVNNPQDRIDLKIDAKPLITHGHYNPGVLNLL